MKLTDIKRSFNSVLKKNKNKYKIYGKDTDEDYTRPCLFTEIIPKSGKNQTQTWYESGVIFKITFLEKEKNEIAQLELYDEIRELFGMYLKVGNRCLTISNISFDYIGEKTDIIQISIDIDYQENTEKPDESENIENIEIKFKEE